MYKFYIIINNLLNIYMLGFKKKYTGIFVCTVRVHKVLGFGFDKCLCRKIIL